MNDNLVDITAILDRSGSMNTLVESTNEGFDGFVAEQRKVNKNVRLTLVQFDTEYEVVYSDRNIHEVPKSNLQPRGGTALLDAIAKTINEKGKKFASMNENDRPGKVIFVILTDGEENASVDYRGRYDLIKEMIERQTNVYNWDFVYLGANQDAIAVGSKLGVAAANCASYAGTGQGMTRSLQATSVKVASYAMSGNKADLSYSDDERKHLMGT